MSDAAPADLPTEKTMSKGAGKTLSIMVFLLVLPLHGSTASDTRVELFSDDFENGLDQWEISNSEAIAIVDAGDSGHGKVLRMAPSDARLRALIRGSDRWRGYRIEGDVLFPDDQHNYLGFVYNLREDEQRIDLGSIYIKGNGSYIRVNPRRDWNPARMLYEEYRTQLSGADAIRIGEWQRFAAEVVGNICHFYVGDMRTPKVTFDYYEYDSGKAGFKPRVIGGPVWIDNIRATSIDGLSHRGPARPEGLDHDPGRLVTDWRALGFLTRSIPEVESSTAPGREIVNDGGIEHRWSRFDTDPRGAVVTGRLVDFLGSRTVAYFTTTVHVTQNEIARFELSTIDAMALWINGVFKGYVSPDRFAWHDFGRNPEHTAPDEWDTLEPGTHRILVRVRGGQYASGGFFARVARGPAKGARE